MSFSNYTVDDSLCCPSRASIFTGRFPHNTGVFTNNSVDGGFHVFHRLGNERQTFATSLQRAGYRTALLGKYLNGYSVYTHFRGASTYVPPGWDRWAVAGWGYPEFNYRLNVDHVKRSYGVFPGDYLTTVLQHFGQDFITSTAGEHQPFFLELATFSPHEPYTPAYADQQSFVGMRAPRGPAFDTPPAHAPPWLDRVPPLDARRVATIDRDYRKRVQAVQSVDRAVDELQRTLAATGQLSNTVFIFSSDNGYHMGQYGLGPGKLTAFDTDVTVPLIIAGPGIAARTVNNDVVQNVDLAPTFDDIAGAPVPRQVDGHSIVALLKRTPGVAWRDAALIEHHGSDFAPHDPDRQYQVAGNPPSYEAIRTARFTYVRYHDGEREYYDRTVDPDELDNIAYTLSAQRVRRLDRWVRALHTCRGAVQCSAAGRLGAG
jgi:arylsulfatase A-like enzyme